MKGILKGKITDLEFCFLEDVIVRIPTCLPTSGSLEVVGVLLKQCVDYVLTFHLFVFLIILLARFFEALSSTQSGID